MSLTRFTILVLAAVMLFGCDNSSETDAVVITDYPNVESTSDKPKVAEVRDKPEVVEVSDELEVVEISDEPEVEYFNLHDLFASNDATVERVQEFLDLSVDVNAKDESGQTPLMGLVSGTSNTEILRLLLRAGADVNAQDQSGHTPLMFAFFHNGDRELIVDLIKAGAVVDAMDQYGQTAIMMTTANQNPESMQVLIRAGAKLDRLDLEGQSALMKAASDSNFELMLVLIRAGADIEAKDQAGRTALMNTAIDSNLDSMQVLISAGADIDAKDQVGRTALMNTAIDSNLDSMQVLISAGAKLDLLDPDGRSALMIAVEDNNLEVMSMLINAGTDVNMRNQSGTTPLLHAVQCSATPELVSVLLTAGADVNARDQFGMTTLLYVVSHNDPHNTSAPLQGSIQWKNADGGNGHWYQIVEFDSWTIARKEANILGAYLGTITTAQENEFVLRKVIGPNTATRSGYVTLGGLKKSRWLWGNQEPFVYTNWHDGHPAGPPGENRIAMYGDVDWRGSAKQGGTWNDIPSEHLSLYLLEWSAGNDDWMLRADVLKVLLEAGADVSAKDADGKTALDLARSNRHLQDTQALRDLEAATNEE